MSIHQQQIDILEDKIGDGSGRSGEPTVAGLGFRPSGARPVSMVRFGTTCHVNQLHLALRGTGLVNGNRFVCQQRRLFHLNGACEGTGIIAQRTRMSGNRVGKGNRPHARRDGRFIRTLDRERSDT